MSGHETGGDSGRPDRTPPDGTRRARVETAHGDSDRAALLAAAVRPDNTDEMDTRTEGSRVVTTVERADTGGLQSTVDDYVVNLQVAAEVAAAAPAAAPSRSGQAGHSDGQQHSNHNTDSDGATSDSNQTETDNE